MKMPGTANGTSEHSLKMAQQSEVKPHQNVK